jgi:hypothetical protein
MSSSIVCNDDCICVNCDCSYKHPLIFPERKIVKKLYNNLLNPIKTETNPETRKANCSYGKLCTKPNCGYRHRLSVNDRMTLNTAYQNYKIQNIKEIKEKPKKEIKQFTIDTSNAFENLFLECTDDIIVPQVVTPLKIDVIPVIIPAKPLKSGFKDALLREKKEIKIDMTLNKDIVPDNWADLCDEDSEFYMKF